MPFLATSGDQLRCSFGTAPSALNVILTSRVLCGMPAANIMDQVPLMNILPFGMCMSPANPMVAAATAAALGVLTPQPCIPAPAGPWMPGCPAVLVGGRPAVSSTCRLMCSYAGVIQIIAPAQTTTMVP